VVVGAAATESRRLKRVTEEEHQLMDPNTAPRIVTDGEGELVLKILWSYVKKWQRYSVLVVDLWCDGSAISRTRGYAPCSMHTLLPGI
jgi:hypothetical protein